MKIKTTLYRQLISIAIIICGIIFISLGLVIPKLLLPIYEKNIYQYLRQPLEVIQKDFDKTELGNIAYLYVVDNNIIASKNLKEIIPMDAKQIITNANSNYGNFKYLGKKYYYYSIKNNHTNKIAITNNNYITTIKSDIMKTLTPIIIITLLIAISIILIWAHQLVTKIKKLKEKVDNLDNDNYKDNYNYLVEDELNVLSEAINEMKITLKKQEEYKNQMYQNISHDFKTPLTVIKSYMEAIDDGVVTKEEGSKVIKEQVNKLETKVHSLLYLNKLTYLSDKIDNNQVIDIKPIIENSIFKFKYQRQEIKFTTDFSGKTKFRGTIDMWEAIIDNLLNNFIRYAKENIKITIKNNKITFYNDGNPVDEHILNDLFTPYEKGINGQFGLGLSIVKRTLNLLGYEISVTNNKDGVRFIVK